MFLRLRDDNRFVRGTIVLSLSYGQRAVPHGVAGIRSRPPDTPTFRQRDDSPGLGGASQPNVEARIAKRRLQLENTRNAKLNRAVDALRFSSIYVA